MKIIAIACARNEEDIVEAFVRHTLAYCQGFVVIENGSTDATADILYRLKDEGLPLHIIHDPTIGNLQVDHANRMLQFAAHELGADWILSVDADEFITTPRGVAGFLPEPLEGNAICYKIPLKSYYPNPADTTGVLNPVERITHRLGREPWPEGAHHPGMHKIIIPGELARQPQAFINQGNHLCYVGGKESPSRIIERAWLSHFTMRSAGQYGVKVAARHIQKYRKIPKRGGEISFYDKVYAGLRGGFTEFLGNFHEQQICYHPQSDISAVVHDPMDYRGGALRYTKPLRKDADLFVEQLLDLTEGLAISAGQEPEIEGAEREGHDRQGLAVEVYNHPQRRPGPVHFLKGDAVPSQALHFPLQLLPGEEDICFHLLCEPGMLEISEITLVSSGAERTFDFRELEGMLRIESNAAAIHCNHVYRMLLPCDTVKVVFRGWKQPGFTPGVLRIKLRYEAGLKPAAILSTNVLNHINDMAHALGRSAGAVAGGIDCHDFPINFTMHGNGHFFTKEGWGDPEPWGIWTVGYHSTLELSLHELPTASLRLDVRAKPFFLQGSRKVRMMVLVDDAPLAAWNLTRTGFQQFSVRIPRGTIKSQECLIRFGVDAPVAPAEIDAQFADRRKLGVGIHSLHLRKARGLLRA